MKDTIDRFTWMAIEHHDDGVVREFYRRLREDRQLTSTQCPACGHVAYPPRPFCPDCHHERVAWVPIGEGATLYAFTTQKTAFRFVEPDVIGVVEIPNVGRILSKINGDLGRLKIGQRVRFEPCVVSDELTVHTFTPVEE